MSLPQSHAQLHQPGRRRYLSLPGVRTCGALINAAHVTRVMPTHFRAYRRDLLGAEIEFDIRVELRGLRKGWDYVRIKECTTVGVGVAGAGAADKSREEQGGSRSTPKEKWPVARSHSHLDSQQNSPAGA